MNQNALIFGQIGRKYRVLWPGASELSEGFLWARRREGEIAVRYWPGGHQKEAALRSGPRDRDGGGSQRKGLAGAHPEAFLHEAGQIPRLRENHVSPLLLSLSS